MLEYEFFLIFDPILVLPVVDYLVITSSLTYQTTEFEPEHFLWRTQNLVLKLEVETKGLYLLYSSNSEVVNLSFPFRVWDTLNKS